MTYGQSSCTKILVRVSCTRNLDGLPSALAASQYCPESSTEFEEKMFSESAITYCFYAEFCDCFMQHVVLTTYCSFHLFDVCRCWYRTQMSASTFSVTSSIIIDAFKQIGIPARVVGNSFSSQLSSSQPSFSLCKLVIRIQFLFSVYWYYVESSSLNILQHKGTHF